MSALRSYAARLGGDISGGQILCPGPGHSAADRSLAVRFDSKSPDDFAVFSFAGDDWRECRDHVRERLGKRDFQPEIRSRNNSRDMGDRVGLARRLWGMRRPIAGSPAERYLREAGDARLFAVARRSPARDDRGVWLAERARAGRARDCA